MASRFGRNRERRVGRQPPFREPKPRILIVCEGAVTEKEYFEQFARFHRESLVELVVESARGVPRTVVDTAIRHKHQANSQAKREADAFLRYESVWCVFDVDDHPNVPNTIDRARANAIELAISNPCFELWLLLHHQDPPGGSPRDKVQKLLKKHITNYNRHVNYDDYKDGYRQAVNRAKSLDTQAKQVQEPGRNPSTGVYLLTERIISPPTSGSARETSA